MEEITKEQLIAAAEDLNKILKLEPPIVTAFETNARGAAKNSAEGKFMNELKAEIISVSEGQDSETEKFDLQIGDIPLLQPETVEIIKTLSPATAERLAAIIDAPAIETPKTSPPVPKEKKQSAADFVPRFLCANPNATKESINTALAEKNLKMSDGMIDAWIRDFGRIMDELQKLGKLKD